MRTGSGFEREGKKECSCTRDNDRAGEKGRATEWEKMRGHERENIGRKRHGKRKSAHVCERESTRARETDEARMCERDNQKEKRESTLTRTCTRTRTRARTQAHARMHTRTQTCTQTRTNRGKKGTDRTRLSTCEQRRMDVHSVCCSVLKCVAVCCSVLQCVAVCCSVLQCVAVCCSVCP